MLAKTQICLNFTKRAVVAPKRGLEDAISANFSFPHVSHDGLKVS
jgi:hypothetical protein